MRRLALLTVLVVAGCGSGGEESDLLGPGEAATLDRQVELVSERAQRGDCDGAERAVARYAELVGQLPDLRDPELRRALRDGATQLEERLAAECEEPVEEDPTTATSTAVTPPPEPTETTPTETTPPETEPPATEPEPEPEPEPTTPVPTTPTAPVPDTGEGGEGGAGDEDSSGSGSDSTGSGSGDSGGAAAPEEG